MPEQAVEEGRGYDQGSASGAGPDSAERVRDNPPPQVEKKEGFDNLLSIGKGQPSTRPGHPRVEGTQSSHIYGDHH
ncbi:hypothetical protein N8772_02570 [Rickettsiales bacterium]|nr:hypothetical protein [Rickettsiales bacterium]